MTLPPAVEHPAPPPPSGPVPWDKPFARMLLADMVRIRRLEEKSAELYGEGRIRGFLHLYIGEEALAVGALHALAPSDNVVATYREHGHALVRGMPMGVIMAEMYGRREGCAHGRGGSMHLFDAGTRLFGGNAIVGGGLPLATGLALGANMQREERVTACFFGDGAVAEGAFHESLNLAALWKLPVLFCCENNLYGMGTAIERAESRTDLVAKAASYDMPAMSCDGMDIVDVHETTKRAVARVRAGAGPAFVEYRTYRFRAHSMFDAELYRDKAEVDEWKTRGPIHTFSARLKNEGKLTEEEFLALDAAANAEVAAAVAFAEAGTWEPVEEMLADVTTPAGECDGCRPQGRPKGGTRQEPEPRSGEHLSPPREGRSGGAGHRVSYREAMREAMREALANDPRVFLMGEDVGRYGGTYAFSKGFLGEFGSERIRDTPLSELGFVGAGIGAALAGMRPIVEVMTVNFSLLALDQIVNTAALFRHMSGGQFPVPLVIRMATGAGRQVAAQHSHSLENWYAHIPGIKVLAPATVEDARGMLAPALADPDPVLIFEHAGLFNTEGEVPEGCTVDIARAKVRRGGTLVSIITYGGSLPKALAATETLAAEGIDAEVVDLRVLRPLDTATIIASVAKCRRAVIVDEGWRTGSLAAEVMARIMENAFYELDAPVARVCSEEVPIPYAKHLEDAALPQAEKIVSAVRKLMGRE